MKLFVEGEIVSSVKKTFDDQDGMPVTYHVNTISSEDGELTVTGIEVTPSLMNVRGVLVIDVNQLFYENGTVKGYKLKLKDFKRGTLPEGEEEVQVED